MTTLTTDIVTISIQGITDDIEAKIDTGAQQTSMHADEIEVSGEDVIFKLNGRTYRAPLEDQQDVSSSDGGTQSRPVIRTSITIAGKSVDTLVNLNDRSEMPQKVLIGQDVIRGAELTLQLTNDPEDANGEEQGDSLTGEPTLAQPGAVDTTSVASAPVVPSAAPVTNIDAELIKRVLKLTVDINTLQRDLFDVVQLINSRESGTNE